MVPIIVNALEQFWLSGIDDVRASGLLLAETTMGLSGEQLIALVTLIVTPIVGGVGFFVKWAFSQVDAIRAMAKERIEAAEKREAEEKAARKEDRDNHNKHLDAATQGITMLTRTVQEQTTMMKSAQDGHREELRRVSDGITQIRAALHRDQA